MADKPSTDMFEAQKTLLEGVISTGVDIIVVNMTGSAMNIEWLDKAENVKAIVQGWYPGAEGGKAIANVLFGERNPSGKLPVTFYADGTKFPDYLDYSMKGRTYRYIEDKPLYPFGYGLSYTEFAYSNLIVEVSKKENESNGMNESNSADENAGVNEGNSVNKSNMNIEDRKLTENASEDITVTLSVDVKNVGQVKGDEIVEVYVKDLASKYEVKNHKLVAFEKVILEAGESKQVAITLASHSFEIVDDEGKRYIDSGKYAVYVGGSQPDERSVELLGRKPLDKVIHLK
jgi:beta-glucosidase